MASKQTSRSKLRTMRSIGSNGPDDDTARSYGLDIKQLKAWKLQETQRISVSEEAQQEISVKMMRNIALKTGT